MPKANWVSAFNNRNFLRLCRRKVGLTSTDYRFHLMWMQQHKKTAESLEYALIFKIMSRNMKIRVSSSHKGASGESLAQSVFESHGWTVAKPEVDTGIDRYIFPINDQGYSDGAVFGAQVKTGTSFLDSPIQEDGEEVGWWFSESNKKFQQWQSSKIPVIVVLCDPANEELYWTLVKESNVISTGQKAKIAVYKTNELRTEETYQRLYEIAQSAGVLSQEYIEFWGLKKVFPPNTWRYSILVPKLLNTQSRQNRKWITAQEAAALLVRGRVSQFSMYARNSFWKGNDEREHWIQGYVDEIKLLKQLARFLRLEVNMEGIITLEGPCELGGSALVPILQALDAETYSKRLEILTDAFDGIDDPVEKGWIKLHCAITSMEMGEVDLARNEAYAICDDLAEFPRDLTALAVSLGAHNLLWHTGVISYYDEELHLRRFANSIFLWQEQPTINVDNILLNRHFDAWSRSSVIRWGVGNVRALANIAYFSQLLRGDVAAFKETCSELGIKMMPLEIDPFFSVSMFLESGKHDKIREVVSRYRKECGIEKLFPLLDRIDLTYVNRRTIQAELVVLQELGEYLEENKAATFVERAIGLFHEPGDRLAYPFFAIEEEIMLTIASLYLSVGENQRISIREFLVSTIKGQQRDDQERAHTFARSLARIPEKDWPESQLVELAELAPEVHWEATRAINNLLALVKPHRKEEAKEDLAQTFGWALAAFDIDERLPIQVAREIINSCASELENMVQKARKGMYTGPGYNYQGILIALNIAHPECADWQSLISFYMSPPISPNFVRNSMSILQSKRQNIPEEIRLELGGALGLYSDRLQDGFLFSCSDHTAEVCLSEVYTTRFLLLETQPSVEERVKFATGSSYRKLALVLIENELRPDSVLENCLRAMTSEDSIIRAEVLSRLPLYFARTGDQGFIDLIRLYIESLGEAALSILSNSVWDLDSFPEEQFWLANEIKKSRSAICRWKAEHILSNLENPR